MIFALPNATQDILCPYQFSRTNLILQAFAIKRLSVFIIYYLYTNTKKLLCQRNLIFHQQSNSMCDIKFKGYNFLNLYISILIIFIDAAQTSKHKDNKRSNYRNDINKYPPA